VYHVVLNGTICECRVLTADDVSSFEDILLLFGVLSQLFETHLTISPNMYSPVYNNLCVIYRNECIIMLTHFIHF
jgi:hypothetical protein